MRVHHQRAYILLNRPYSETSWIVEVFSREFGRLALMAKGARRIKSKLKGSLLPFQPVLLSWSGKGEIPTLTSAEIDQTDYHLSEHELRGDALVCGFYCNELIVNLLHRHDPHAALFDQYHATVLGLSNPVNVDNRDSDKESSSNSMRQLLRGFEKVVMKETGYEVNFDFEADGKTRIIDDGYYRYQAGQGFVRQNGSAYLTFSGRVVKSLNAEDRVELSSDEFSQGKRLMRDILQQTLGPKQIVSRELFFPKAR